MDGGSEPLSVSRPPGGRVGFTLLEVLVVFSLLSALSGLVWLAAGPSRFAGEGRERAREAALRGAQWLQGRLLQAREEGRNFRFRVSLADRLPYLEIRWEDTGLWERYDSGENAWFRGEGPARWAFYSTKWHTLSPGMVLYVFSDRESSPAAVAFIVISPACRVSVVREGP